MRKAGWELCLLLVAITGIHTFKIMRSGIIHGKVFPVNAMSVLAISGSDSVRAISEDGQFALMVNPGIWKVIVAGKENSVVCDHVEVSEGKKTNLGEIRLSQ